MIRCVAREWNLSPEVYSWSAKAFALAEKPSFRNCLVTMRPSTRREEIPSTHIVRTQILNNFADYLSDNRQAICAAPGTISTNWDMWTEDQTSKPYLGLIGSWIDVTPECWTLRAEVLAFHIVMGAHDGDNLGRYFVKFLDRAGVTGKEYSKVSPINSSQRLALKGIYLARVCDRRQCVKQLHSRKHN